jgi:hypothetical protein
MKSRGPYSSSTVELVDDIERMVLDYVRTPHQTAPVQCRSQLSANKTSQLSLYPDLQAICLTSKDWNCVGTEYLYKKIVLDIRFRDGQLVVFRRCLDIGAKNHLIHARRLSLLDVLWEMGDFVPYGKPMDQATGDSLILEILQAFPRNKLREFR